MNTQTTALAEQAAQAIRALNHLTRPAAGTLHPAGIAAIITALAQAAHRLPQLLAQLDANLARQAQAGRLQMDAGAPAHDTAEAIAGITAALAQAAHSARHAGAALDGAHQLLAHLATQTTCEETVLP